MTNIQHTATCERFAPDASWPFKQLSSKNGCFVCISQIGNPTDGLSFYA